MKDEKQTSEEEKKPIRGKEMIAKLLWGPRCVVGEHQGMAESRFWPSEPKWGISEKEEAR